MIAGIDTSAARPNPGLAEAFKSQGVTNWAGYLATRGGTGISEWSQQDFDNARLCGTTPIGYCSGWDDPVGVKNLAAQWNVRACLDVEGGIRGDGPWVQGWLDASGAGLYGNGPVHNGRNAAFHILAAYPGYDPNATWGEGYPVPNAPHGWQWQGTHTENGISVDRTWLDDWFATGGDEMDQVTAHGLVRMIYMSRFSREPTVDELTNWANDVMANGLDHTVTTIYDGSPTVPTWGPRDDQLQGEIDQIKASPPSGVTLQNVKDEINNTKLQAP